DLEASPLLLFCVSDLLTFVHSTPPYRKDKGRLLTVQSQQGYLTGDTPENRHGLAALVARPAASLGKAVGHLQDALVPRRVIAAGVCRRGHEEVRWARHLHAGHGGRDGRCDPLLQWLDPEATLLLFCARFHVETSFHAMGGENQPQSNDTGARR